MEIAPGVALSPSFAIETSAIMAQKRKGKTYLASVIAEELVKAGQPWVVLDPTGAWWGFRSSADGKGDGMPVVIIGGTHGDLPLDRTMGRAVADFVVEHRGWYVVDMSELGSRAAEREFASAFGDQLHRRQRQAAETEVLLLIIDEADLFLPQEKEHGDNEVLGVFSGIVRRAGLDGLGVLLISQRPALVSKHALTQIDRMYLLRIVGGNDQDAVSKNYLSRALDKPTLAEVMATLARLPIGEVWEFEPAAEPSIMRQFRARERLTYNSSATPKPGQKQVVPEHLSAVDLGPLRDHFEQAIARAEAEDPKALRRRVRELEQAVNVAHRNLDAERIEWQAHECVAPAEVQVEVRPVEVVPVWVAGLIAGIKDSSMAVAEAASNLASSLIDAAQKVEVEGEHDRETVRAAQDDAQRPPAPPAARRAVRDDPAPVARPRPQERARAPRQRDAGGDAVDARAAGLNPSERKIVTALYQFGPRPRSVLALLCSTHERTKGHTNAIGSLRSAGLVSPAGVDPMHLTDDGEEVAQALDVEPLPRGDELVTFLKQHPSIAGVSGAGRVLDVVLVHGPLSHDDLADWLGLHPRTKGLTNGLGRLRSLGLVTKGAPIEATPMLRELLDS